MKRHSWISISLQIAALFGSLYGPSSFPLSGCLQIFFVQLYIELTWFRQICGKASDGLLATPRVSASKIDGVFFLKNACRSVKSAWACVHHDSSSNRLSAMVVDVMAWTLRQQDISPTGWPKQIGTILLYALTSSNSNRFSKSFHCQNQEKNCNNISLTIPPHIKCVATLPCEMSSVCRSVSLIAPLVTTPAWVRRPAAFDVKTAGCDSY